MVHLAFGKGPLGRVAQQGYQRAMGRQVRGQGTGRKSSEHIRRDLERNLDAIESLIEGREFFVDDAPRLADFALLGQLHYLSRTPTGTEALQSRPAIRAFLERMRRLRESK